MKVLNLYAGIGGNRKLWDDCEVTAVESNSKILDIYLDHFPTDNIHYGDAHKYLLENYDNFDFIWSSPPRQSHSSFRQNICVRYRGTKPVYPDMSLYQEIIFLTHFFKGKFIIENVNPYYKPLIDITLELGRHFIWANFLIHKIEVAKNTIHRFAPLKSGERIDNCKDGHFGIYIDKYKVSNKEKIRRNAVDPAIGLHIINRALEIQTQSDISQPKLF